MNTELPVTNRQFLIILLTNAESSVDCCRYNLDLLKLSRWYAQAEDWDYEKIREMYAEPPDTHRGRAEAWPAGHLLFQQSLHL
ncbi:hypothetical protein A191_04199 [Escherichia coli KTE233]|nr:hypothetical protein A191_04199 [Escherichia coli KTE233]